MDSWHGFIACKNFRITLMIDLSSLLMKKYEKQIPLCLFPRFPCHACFVCVACRRIGERGINPFLAPFKRRA